jgi:hypothetical protein
MNGLIILIGTIVILVLPSLITLYLVRREIAKVSRPRLPSHYPTGQAKPRVIVMTDEKEAEIEAKRALERAEKGLD